MIKYNIPIYLADIGRKIKQGWEIAAKKHNIDIQVSGIDPLGHFSFRYKNPLVLKTLFTQFMLDKGFLATTAFYAPYAHKEKYIQKYLTAVDKAFGFILKAIKSDKPEKYLKSSVCHSGFKRLT